MSTEISRLLQACKSGDSREGTLLDGGSSEELLGVLRRVLTLQLKRRDLWTKSPSCLQVTGSRWDDAALDELVTHAYHYVVERIRRNTSKFTKYQNLETLVILLLRNFLTDRQRKSNPRNTHSDVDVARERHGELVDKKFATSLGSEEERELGELEQLLDHADAGVYEPIKRRLRAEVERLSSQRGESDSR